MLKNLFDVYVLIIHNLIHLEFCIFVYLNCSAWNKVSEFVSFLYKIVVYLYLHCTSNMPIYNVRIRKEDNSILYEPFVHF